MRFLAAALSLQQTADLLHTHAVEQQSPFPRECRIILFKVDLARADATSAGGGKGN